MSTQNLTHFCCLRLQWYVPVPQAGDPDELGVVSFVNLIQLLSKHRLYISESGLIARYGKTKGAEGSRLNPRQLLLDHVQQFVLTHIPSLAWFTAYILLNLLLFVVGLTMTEREGWKRWAYGCGPVLSMNCVLVLLPTLSSVILNMKNSPLMAKVCELLHSPCLLHFGYYRGCISSTL